MSLDAKVQTRPSRQEMAVLHRSLSQTRSKMHRSHRRQVMLLPQQLRRLQILKTFVLTWASPLLSSSCPCQSYEGCACSSCARSFVRIVHMHVPRSFTHGL